MIFLSAQPDDFYFSWQLELQIINFEKCGIALNTMHVLLGYPPEKGLSLVFQELMDRYKGVRFFTYPDKRTNKNYPSAIRPHIIAQHFNAFPELAEEIIFYHDSDIIFRELPDFSRLNKGDDWFVSDTRSYIDIGYIKSSGNHALFLDMCAAVKIRPQTVTANDQHAGGAQYLIKKTTCAFWSKVEKDSEALFNLLSQFNNTKAETEYQQLGTKRSEVKGIQAWCADMWSVLWNAWLLEKEVKIDKELDFCWPKDPIDKWYTSKTLHYSGVTKEDKPAFFCKTDYTQYPPYDEDFAQINPQSCSKPIVELVNDYRQSQRKTRIDLRDTTFLIPVRIDSEDRLENILVVARWIDKFFDTHIIIGECDSASKIPSKALPPSCKKLFFKHDDLLFNHTWVNNQLIKASTTAIIGIYDSDVIFPVHQVTEAVHVIRTRQADVVSPYDGAFVGVDQVFKKAFIKLTDTDLLYHNRNKFTTATQESWGGAVFINKTVYISAGGDNEFFTSWGPEDIERIKRLENLGCPVKRIAGPLFHLYHNRKSQSGYVNSEAYVRYMEEYFRISQMNSSQIQAYISTWAWKKDLSKSI